MPFSGGSSNFIRWLVGCPARRHLIGQECDGDLSAIAGSGCGPYPARGGATGSSGLDVQARMAPEHPS
jgi:hypothetical protein